MAPRPSTVSLWNSWKAFPTAMLALVVNNYRCETIELNGKMIKKIRVILCRSAEEDEE